MIANQSEKKPRTEKKAAPIFDWRINLALILALFLQISGAMFWIGQAAQRLDDFDTRFAQQAPVAERLARLETEMNLVRQSLTRIENGFENVSRSKSHGN